MKKVDFVRHPTNNPYILYRLLAIYLRWLFPWRHLDSLHRADESQQGRNSCPRLQLCCIGSSRVVCHAKSIFCHLVKYDRLGGPCSIVCLFQFHFSAHRSDPLLDPTLAALSSAVPCCFSLLSHIALSKMIVGKTGVFVLINKRFPRRFSSIVPGQKA